MGTFLALAMLAVFVTIIIGSTTQKRNNDEPIKRFEFDDDRFSLTSSTNFDGTYNRNGNPLVLDD